MHESLCAEGKGVLSSSFPLFLPFSFLCNFSLVPGGQSSLHFFLLLFCALSLFFPGPFSFIFSWTLFPPPSPSLTIQSEHAHTHTHTLGCKYPSNIMSLFEEAELPSIPKCESHLWGSIPSSRKELIGIEPRRWKDELSSQRQEHMYSWVTLLRLPRAFH